MKTITKQIRAERRLVASDRKQAYDLLTIDQKLARLPVNGAKKQRARLLAQLPEPAPNTKRSPKG
jgi:hypothetical protein